MSLANIRELFRITLCLFISGAAMPCEANDRTYHYKLEMGGDKPVCRHMLEVYNSNFKQPWKTKDWRKKLIGTPGSSKREADEDFLASGRFAFPKLPGVQHNPEFTSMMQYSKLPTSPEFEAIHWQEGRYAFKGGEYQYPFLFAEFDIDNDGTKEMVFKSAFMHDFVAGGWWNHNDADHDHLNIFGVDGFTLGDSQPIDGGKIYHGSADGQKPRFIEARQIRPFIFDGITYLSEFEPIWPANELAGLPTGKYPFPVKEYINIVKYVGGGLYLDAIKYSEVESVLICRLRMVPLR